MVGYGEVRNMSRMQDMYCTSFRTTVGRLRRGFSILKFSLESAARTCSKLYLRLSNAKNTNRRQLEPSLGFLMLFLNLGSALSALAART